MTDQTGAIVALLPTASDPIVTASSEPAHITTVWLGETVDDVAADAIVAQVRELAAASTPLTVEPESRGTLGDDGADVVFVDADDAEPLRELLLAEGTPVRAAYDAVEQFPEWTPHITLGYPETPAAGEYDVEAHDRIAVDRIAVWIGDRREEFPLGGGEEQRSEAAKAQFARKDQPRAARGSEIGGQWIRDGGAGTATAEPGSAPQAQTSTQERVVLSHGVFPWDVEYSIGPYYGEDGEYHRFFAIEDGERVGELYVETDRLVIMNIETDADRRGEGIARSLYEQAEGYLPAIYHAPEGARTPEGDAFARAVGGPVLDWMEELEDAVFAVDPDARTISGLLLPFDELSRESIDGTQPVMFSAGAVKLPADPSVVTLYEGNDHDRHSPRGRAAAVQETERGVVAAFAVARTPEGDALLARAERAKRDGRPLRLSAEIGGLMRRGLRAIAGHLTGAAVCDEGAFASAGLFALATDANWRPNPSVASEVSSPATIPAGEDQTSGVAGGGATPAASEQTPEAETPAADNQKEEDIVTGAVATIPEGVTAGGAENQGSVFAAITSPPEGSASGASNSGPGADALFSALASAMQGRRDGLQAFAGSDALFAIAPVQHSGPGGVTIGADTQAPRYLGELWSRNPYMRRFVPLFGHEDLTSYQATGWRWVTPPTVGDYAGNTAEVPSNAVDTEAVTVNAERIAGGHKLDRRFIDFNDTGVYASYLSHVTEDYKRKSDAKVLAAAVTAAGADLNVTGKSYPWGTAAGLAGVIDGALAILEGENTPTGAVVAPGLWRDIVLTGRDEVLGYLSASLGLEDGELDGFKLVPGGVPAGKVLVVSKPCLTVHELAGSPIRVEGIDPHHGAIDPAVFGYLATIASAPAGLKIVDTTDYTAPAAPIVIEAP